MKIKEVDELLNNYFEDKITFAEFDLRIIQWAVNERVFIKNEKIENQYPLL